MDACVVCTLPLDAPGFGRAFRGIEDGRGEKFVHEECYWRRYAEDLNAHLVGHHKCEHSGHIVEM